MTVLPDGVAQADAALMLAWETGEPCAPIRTLLADGDAAAAYAVQNLLTERRLAAGRRLVGRKIGLTSPAVQKQLGVDQPDFGMLFDDMDVPQGQAIPWGRVMQPKVEAEVAFVLGRDLSSDWLTTADLIGAVDYAVAAIEVVGSRIASWDIRFVDTVADNASAALYVLGHQPRRLSDIDLIGARMEMTREEAVVSSGAGSACMGSPLTATLWLARTMQALGRPLLAGDVVLSGALGPMVAVEPGQAFTARIEGLGDVSVAFGEPTS
jgi:2-keto-4-pentenoate hydratase